MATLLALLGLLLLLVARQAKEEAQDGLQVALLDVCTQYILFSMRKEVKLFWVSVVLTG